MPEEKAQVPGGSHEAPAPSGPPQKAPRSKRPPRPPKTARARMFLLGMSLFALTWLVAAHYVLPVKYTATTIFERRSDAASPEQTSDVPESVQSLRLTMQQDLMGFDAVAQAAEDLELMRGLPHDDQGKLTPAGEAQRQELILRLMASVSVAMLESPAVDRVSVSFTGSDPRLVQELPDTLVRNYINRASNEIVSRLAESKEFLQKQVEEGRTRMQELTASLTEFQMKHAGMLPEDPGVIQDDLLKIATDIDMVRRQQTVATQSVAKLKEMMAARKPSDGAEPTQIVKGPNPELGRLKEELSRADDRLELAMMLVHIPEVQPMVAALSKKVQDLEARINETPLEVVLETVYGQGTTVPDDLDMQLASAESSVELTTNELQRLYSRQSLYQNLLANFGPVRQQYLRLRTDLAEQEAKANAWEARLAGVEMALAAEVAQRRTHLNAIQLAQPQYRPASPRLDFVLGVALLGGFLIGIGCALAPIRFSLGRRLLLTLELLVVMLSMGLGAMSSVLWLEYPDQHEKWKAEPVAYLAGKADAVWAWVTDGL